MKLNFLKKLKKIKNKNKIFIFIVLFIICVFSRFYLLEERLNFNWDQVDNAWAAKRILVDNNYPLLGMQAKLNSGFSIGPIYYYIVAFFYWIFNLNPIASGFLASISSIFTFCVLFIILKKLFSYNVAIIGGFIYTFSFFILSTDRSQWPVNLVTSVSLIVFYSLYKIIIGKIKYLILLALSVGFSFHLHFTSVFYPIIIFLTLPFFPRNKKTLYYIFFSILIFILFLSPLIINEFQAKNSEIDSLNKYLNTYYHGFHLTRVFQLIHDAFIEFDLILQMPVINLFSWLFLPIFIVIYLFKEKTKNKFLFCYLALLWFIIPWFVFSTYSGEITNYYFYVTRPIVIIIYSYISFWILSQKNLIFKICIALFWIYFLQININKFFSESKSDYQENIKRTMDVIKKGEFKKPYENIPESYLYYYFTEIKNN